MISGAFFEPSSGGGGGGSISVSVSPQSASLSAGQSQQFTATVTGTSNQNVIWTISPTVGSISGGLYTAPSTISNNQSVTVTATSQADGNTAGTASINLTESSSVAGVYCCLDDQIGTTRVIAEVPQGQNTATLCYDADFYPFGGEREVTDSYPQNYKFTGKERDTESNLDNFGARYYASASRRTRWAIS
ncbi:MAG: Ig-like domain-containing protein [Candidatus Acidiferrales bacterium]